MLSQAKDVHETLDTVAKDVSAALRTMLPGSFGFPALTGTVANMTGKRRNGVL